MMTRTLITALLAFASIPLSAAPPNLGAALRTYVTRALAKCPDSKLEMSPINRPGPAGFVPFTVTLTSIDTSCGRQTYALFSPTTSQLIIGTSIGLPLDNRSAQLHL